MRVENRQCFILVLFYKINKNFYDNIFIPTQNSQILILLNQFLNKTTQTYFIDPFRESVFFAFSLLQYQTECLTLPSVLYYTPSPHLRVILHSPLLMSHTLSVLSYEPLTTLSSSTCHQRKVIKCTEQHNVENSMIFSTGKR